MKKEISAVWYILIIFALFPAGCNKEEKQPDTLTDIEENTYKTVIIGDQVWMAENLRTTRMNDGTAIPLVIDVNAWAGMTSAGYCWYNNNMVSYKDKYGALYNGYTIIEEKLCPSGWHIPDKQEWRTLREFLGDSVNGGGKLKEAGTTNWLSPNKGADNSSGFTALGAGIRYFEGTFSSLLSYTAIWSNSGSSNDDVWCTSLYFADAVFNMDHRNKKHGFSVRCLKD